MDDAAAVRGDQRIGELDAEVDDALGCQRPFGLDRLVEGAAVEELADEKRLSVLFAGIVDGADVRVRDERCDPRFTAEALERAGCASASGRSSLSATSRSRRRSRAR